MKNSIKGMRIPTSIFCLFCLLFFGISSHSDDPIPESEDFLTVIFEENGEKVYGYGYVWVGDLDVYPQEGDLPLVAESRHITSFYHYLVESNVKCDYIFVTKVANVPAGQFETESFGSGTAKKYDPDTNTTHLFEYGTTNHLTLGGLPEREGGYKLRAYTRLTVDDNTKSTYAWIPF